MEIEMETEINKSKMSVYVLYPVVMTTARGGASLGTGGGGVIPGGVIAQLLFQID